VLRSAPPSEFVYALAVDVYADTSGLRRCGRYVYADTSGTRSVYVCVCVVGVGTKLVYARVCCLFPIQHTLSYYLLFTLLN